MEGTVSVDVTVDQSQDEVGRKHGEITAALGILHSTIGALDAALDDLFVQIQPCLTPVAPAGVQDGNEEAKSARSEVAVELEGLTERVHRLVGRVVAATLRVEF